MLNIHHYNYVQWAIMRKERNGLKSAIEHDCHTSYNTHFRPLYIHVIIMMFAMPNAHTDTCTHTSHCVLCVCLSLLRQQQCCHGEVAMARLKL